MDDDAYDLNGRPRERPARPARAAQPVRRMRSAGLLLFRVARGADGDVEVLLGHMGGPFWARRDAGAWTVVKGEYGAEEDPQEAARREFREELGMPVPDGELVPLGETRQAGGKVVAVWALEGDLDPLLMVPGTFAMEWPRGSGRIREFPEIDTAAWLDVREAREKIVRGQRVFLDRLAGLRAGGPAPGR